MIKQQDFLFKIVIVGNQGVGKSSLFLRFCDDNFVQNYLPTIGVDFRFKMLEIDDHFCKLQIWDTAGQQRFRTITSAYYRGCDVALVVYDVTDISSFKEIEDYWIQEVKNNTDHNIMICIVGNKCDMETQIVDTELSGLIESIGLVSYKVSARSGEGVEAMFNEICVNLIKSGCKPRKQKTKTTIEKMEQRGKNCCG